MPQPQSARAASRVAKEDTCDPTNSPACFSGRLARGQVFAVTCLGNRRGRGQSENCSGGPHEGYRLDKAWYDGVDAQAFGVEPYPFANECLAIGAEGRRSAFVDKPARKPLQGLPTDRRTIDAKGHPPTDEGCGTSERHARTDGGFDQFYRRHYLAKSRQ